jgi:divalent metal cation (Fe/Co/Zn/Cd) transporter
MIWRFRKGDVLSTEDEEKIEKRAIKLVAYTFFVLGGYVVYESAKSLLYADIPERSIIGIIILVLSILIMPFLAYTKYRTGKQLGSKSLMADAKQTFFCIILSFTTLIGIGLNYFWGLWQADPIAGLIIGLYLWKEGYEAFQGDVD